MPLMMDDDSYMKELFGDSDSVPLHTPAPPIKGLGQRLNELHESGCCQKIAWSKSGCIAWITPDGRGVELRSLYRNAQDGKWQLNEEAPLQLPQMHDESLITHVDWIHVGTDLAVVDTAGRIFIFTRAFGRMNISKVTSVDQDDELGCLVGLHWLAVSPHQTKNHIPWGAVRNGDKWTYEVGRHAFNDPRHPYDMRAALIGLSKNGVLKLLYQQPDDSWSETTKEIDHPHSTKDHFTHAAFASNSENALLMATYSISGFLQLHRIKINWSVPARPNQGEGQQQQPTQPVPLPPPSIEVLCLATEDRCHPVDGITEVGSDLTTNPGQRLPVSAQLSHFLFLPRTPNGTANHPTILAAFAHLPSPIAGLEQTTLQQNPYSTVIRWDVHLDHQVRLHPSLDQLSSKKKRVGNAGHRSTPRLQRQPDIRTDATVLSIDSIHFNTMLAFSQSDSSIEFRDRPTLDIVGPDYSNDRVTSLPQAGFAFASGDTSVNSALSANNCMSIGLRSDGTPILRTMEYTHGLLGAENDLKQGAAVAAIALQHCAACHQYFFSDDVFALIKNETPQNFKHTLNNQIWDALRASADAVELSEKQLWMVIRSYPIIKCLSAQLLLGLHNDNARDLPGQIAWGITQFRHVGHVLHFVAQCPPPVLGASVPLIRRVVGLQTYIVQELLELAESLRSTPDFNKDTLQEKIHKFNSPALHLLLASIPRGLMRVGSSALTHITQKVIAYINHPESLEARNALYPVFLTTRDPAVSLDIFRTLLTEVTSSVVEAYKQAGLSDAERAKTENDMALSGDIPDCLLPVVKRILFKVLSYHPASSDADKQQTPNSTQNILAQTDIPRILFADLRWLGMYSRLNLSTPTTTTISSSNNNRFPASFIDVITGEEIKTKKGDKLRKCVRCSSYTEDLAPGGKPTLTTKPTVRWALNLGKTCVCQGLWIVKDGVSEENGDAED